MSPVQTIWIETGQGGTSQRDGVNVPVDFIPGGEWQGVFACQIIPRSFDDRMLLKWGFNAAALFPEALDRQRLFVESQHFGNPTLQEGLPEKRTLALRCIRNPNQDGLALSLIGKICAATREDVLRDALSYCQEICAIFPYDYRIIPATDRENFIRLAGWQLLQACSRRDSLVQIRRMENNYFVNGKPIYLLGFWQTSDHSDEQIWRGLIGYPGPILVNICLRPAVISNFERQILSKIQQNTKNIELDNHPESHQIKSWAESTLNRRLAFGPRSYYVQIQIASPDGVKDSILRAIGSAVTRSADQAQSFSGFESIRPINDQEAVNWSQYIHWLEFLTGSRFGPDFERLKDLSDLAETCSVFRLPYPPEPDFADIRFVSPEAQDGNTGNHTDEASQ